MSDRNDKKTKPDDSARKDDPKAEPSGQAQARDQKPGDDQKPGEDEEGEKGPGLFQKPIFWIILIVSTAVIVIGALLYWLHARQFESTDDAFVDAHIVRIAAQSSGQVMQVADIDNRHVEAGKLLAVIEPSGPEARLAEAQAGVTQAEAQANAAWAQVGAARSQADQAAAQAEAPLATADKAAKDLARYEELRRLDPSAVAGQQLDQARANAQSTAAQATAARRAVSSAQAQVSVADRQAKAAEAGISARRAQVSQARVTLNDLRLTAPISGQVVNRQVNVGSFVAPGTNLMAIVPDVMWITANFKETQLQHMRIGQPVTIKVDAYPDVEFHGRVDSVQRGAGQAFALLPPQNATGNYVKVVQRVPVRINFVLGDGGADPRQYPIGPGMSVVPTVKVR